MADAGPEAFSLAGACAGAAANGAIGEQEPIGPKLPNFVIEGRQCGTCTAA